MQFTWLDSDEHENLRLVLLFQTYRQGHNILPNSYSERHRQWDKHDIFKLTWAQNQGFQVITWNSSRGQWQWHGSGCSSWRRLQRFLRRFSYCRWLGNSAETETTTKTHSRKKFLKWTLQPDNTWTSSLLKVIMCLDLIKTTFSTKAITSNRAQICKRTTYLFHLRTTFFVRDPGISKNVVKQAHEGLLRQRFPLYLKLFLWYLLAKGHGTNITRNGLRLKGSTVVSPAVKGERHSTWYFHILQIHGSSK